MEESAVFTFPYQTNENHAMEPSTFGHVNLRKTLERCFWFHWNCKQLQVETRSSMLNSDIYFPIFSETIHTNLNIFDQNFCLGCLSTFKKCYQKKTLGSVAYWHYQTIGSYKNCIHSSCLPCNCVTITFDILKRIVKGASIKGCLYQHVFEHGKCHIFFYLSFCFLGYI